MCCSTTVIEVMGTISFLKTHKKHTKTENTRKKTSIIVNLSAIFFFFQEQNINKPPDM